jgi:uncharacterized Zn-binding protein involved in type VI secretion
MKEVIRLGDSTSHGGSVVSTSAPHYTVGGKPVACVGDQCTCPVPGHGACVIVEGCVNHFVNGKAVARHGHKTSCGATLISSAANYAVDG